MLYVKEMRFVSCRITTTQIKNKYMNNNAILLFFIILIKNSCFYGQQNTFELKVKAANYEIGTSKIIIDLEFINTSNDTLYLIQPQNIFFDKHYQGSVPNYPQLTNYPYKMSLESNKKCLDEEVARPVMSISTNKNVGNEDFFIIYPNETKVFNGILINVDDIQFCDIGKYFVKIEYNIKIEETSLKSSESSNNLILQLNKIKTEIQSKKVKCFAIKAK